MTIPFAGVKASAPARGACSVLLLALAAAALRVAAAQEPGEQVVLPPGEVTAERLIELLAPPGTARLAIGAPRMQAERPRCEVLKRRLTRGIEVVAISPFAALPITFAFNSAAITPEAVRPLTELGKALTSPALASSCFTIEGHTDNIGSDAVNDRLSQLRAEAVVRYLTATFGIEGQRLVARGFGKRVPLADNGSEAGRQTNRRVNVANVRPRAGEP